MFYVLLSVILICLVTWVLLKWRSVNTFWLNKGVPHEKPNFIFGSLTFLQRENPSIWVRRLYNDFKSPYVGVWLFWRPALVVNDPGIARNILVKDQEVFRNRFLSSGKSDPIGALNLFTVNDPLWSSVRRRLTVAFTAAKLRSLNKLVADKANDLIQRIEEVKDGNNLELRNLCVDYTTDVIGEAAFGISCKAARTGDSVIRRIARDMMQFNLQRGLSWSCIFFLPELVDVFRFSLFPKRTMAHMREILRTVIQQRGGYSKEIKESKDLLDALLKIRQEAAADSEEISEDLLLAQVAIFLLGGFDTSAVALTWCLYELAWNPLCQEKLYREISEVKQKIGDQPLDNSMLIELTYLDCIIKEVLRKFPPMGWLDRIASKNYQIDEKLTIPAGTVVYINAMGMQHDAQYFENPQVFDPDRFLPENEMNIHPYVYLPFGEGPRGCIAKRFGFQTVRCGLANVILNYELKPLPNTSKPNDCLKEKNGLFYTPGEKLKVDFIARNNSFIKV